MKAIKDVLIIIDGSPQCGDTAALISKSLSGVRCLVRIAAEFNPVDLLPADAYFFGCETDRPASFKEVERVLKGINLAGKPCGLFSVSSKKAIDYLRSIVADSELRLHPVPFFSVGQEKIGTWAAAALNQR